MPTPWLSVINPIIDGEAVKAATPNRPILELKQRTDYLFEQLRLAATGSALVARAVTLDPAVSVGDVVYFEDTGTPGYYKSIAETEASTDVGQWFASKRANVAGIVILKNGTTGDLLIGGSLDLSLYLSAVSKTLNDLVDDGVFSTGGQFYVSAVTAGKLTKTRSVVSAYVGSISADGVATINPTTIGSNRDHTHFMHELVVTPAGTTAPPALPTDLHVITAPNVNLRGWLPANTTYFPALDYVIPAGAKFGYNIGHVDEDALRANFPPVPLEFYYIEKDGVGLDTWTVVVNSTGIWWLTDSYGQAPWPADYAGTGDSGDEECVDIKFWITKVNLTNSNIGIVNLGPYTADSTRIPVECIVGSTATDPATGIVKLATAQLTNNTVADNSKAVSSISGGVLNRTRVVSSIVPGPGLAITGGVGSEGNSTIGFSGPMTISLAGLVGFTGSADLIVLNGAREDVTNGLHHLTLPAGKNTSIRYKVKLGQLPSAGNLNIKVTYYCKVTGTIPALNLNYRVQALPTTSTPISAVLSDTSLVANIAASPAMTAGQIVTITNSTAIAANPGSVVYLEIFRTSSDGYPGDIAILDTSYVFG